MMKLQLICIVMLLTATMLTSCAAPKLPQQETAASNTPTATSTPHQADYIKLSPEEARDMMSDDVIILDVRTQEEYDSGHIANAILIPDYEIVEKAEIVIADKNQTILVYCRTGRRSERASKKLIELGYTKVYDFGGIESWTGEIVGNERHPSYYNYFGDTLPPDIDVTIDFVTTQKISEQLPEFTFRLTGSNTKACELFDNKTKYYFDFKRTQIDNITITDNTGAIIQTINGLDTNNPASEKLMYGLSFDDWNFDGFIDISLWKYPGGTSLNSPHYYWLWDNNAGLFAENAELIEISNYSLLGINLEEKQLECITKYGGFGNISQIYQYKDNKFVLVSFVEYKLASSPNEDDKYIIRITTGELVDGTMVVTEEYKDFVD